LAPQITDERNEWTQRLPARAAFYARAMSVQYSPQRKSRAIDPAFLLANSLRVQITRWGSKSCSYGPGVCWNHRRLDKWRIWTRIVAIPEILPIGVLHFPGTGIQDNLADKAKKLGIPVWKFGAG